jgi:hypothetical protein
MVKQESHLRTRSAEAPVEIAVILHRRAKAGRAHHGAVAAGQAALSDLIPSRMVQIALQ